MEFNNQFRVTADPDTTFATLSDLEKVAPCLPGAVLEDVDGDTYTGRVKVKVGPMQMTYRGTARLAEVDPAERRGRIEAQGREARGSGTAAADVTATVEPDGDGSLVTVATDLKVTGKPAQFGRGVMAEVGSKIIDAFAERLQAMLGGEQAPDAAAAPPTAAAGSADPAAVESAGVDTPEPAAAAPDPAAAAPAAGEPRSTEVPAAASTGPRRIEPQAGRENDALNLMDVAGGATLKRLVPAVIGIVVVIALVWWLVGR